MIISLFPNRNEQKNSVLLSGKDALLNDYVAKAYLKRKEFETYEHVVIDCEENGLNDLVGIASESSLFYQQKLVLVRNPFFLTSKSSKTVRKQLLQLEKIFSQLDKRQDVFVFEANYDKLDRRKKITKILLEQCHVVKTDLKTYQIDAFIRQLAKLEGYQFDRDAEKLLMMRSDQVLDITLANFNKLKFVVSDHRITYNDVAKNIDQTLAQNVFEILTVALRGKMKEAILRLKDYIHEGANPVQLLAIFENQLEFLLCVKLLQPQKSEQQIATTLNSHPYRVKLAMANQVSVHRLKKLLNYAISLDYGYKTGKYRDSLFLELFLLRSTTK